MKSIKIIAMCVSILMLITACGIQQPLADKQPDSVETTALTSTDIQAIGGYEDVSSRERPNGFYFLDASLVEYADGKGDKEHTYGKEYVDLYVNTLDFNPRSFCRYYGITKDEYAGIYAYLKNVNDDNLKSREYLREFIYIDELFGTQEQFNSKFTLDTYDSLTVKSEEIMSEGCTEHTYTYHTIHYTLIEYVGSEKYAEFKKQFAGTEDFNILNFIKYFDIDRPTYEKIISADGWTDEYGVFRNYARPYNPDYLYGDDEIVKKYFYCHPIE